MPPKYPNATAFNSRQLAKAITERYPEINPQHAMTVVACVADMIADDYKVLLGMLHGARERRNAKENRLLELRAE